MNEYIQDGLVEIDQINNQIEELKRKKLEIQKDSKKQKQREYNKLNWSIYRKNNIRLHVFVPIDLYNEYIDLCEKTINYSKNTEVSEKMLMVNLGKSIRDAMQFYLNYIKNTHIK